MRTLAGDISPSRRKIRACERDLLMVDDIKPVKAWFTALQRRSAMAHLDEMSF
jgi:hypothetical protein